MQWKINRPRVWTHLLAGGLAAAGLSGCTKTIFVEPGDHKEALRIGIPDRLETHPHDPIAPSMVDPGVNPATVLDPSRPPRYLSLKEAIAVAVEGGNLGSQGGLQNAGFVNDNLVQFGGRQVSGTDSVRALVLDPAVVGADIERSLSKFDARWITSMSWNKQDQPTLTLQQSFSNGDSANFNTTLAKPLPTGGVAGITMSMAYQSLSQAPSNTSFVTLPASYTPRLQFVFEQPLLQNFGVEVNQLSSAHPGSSLISGLRASGGTTTEGILIARIRYDQQKVQFDFQINQMLVNVEYAYWTLYAAYYNLYAQEETLREVYNLYTILKRRLEVGSIKQQDLEQTLAQYWLFRGQVLQARDQVLTSERQLRGLLGMRSDTAPDRLVPSDEPNLAPFQPDYYSMANDALAYRPELILARHDLKFRQLDIIFQKNQRRPDLRFFSTYDIQGLGSRLDGSPTLTSVGTDPNTGAPTTTSTPQNALDSFMTNQFNSYQIGLRLDMPLGFRDANAAVRQSQLNLYRSFYQLHDSERKALEVLTRQYATVMYQQENIRVLRNRRLASQRALVLNKTLIEGGQWNVDLLNNVLTIQRDVANAVASEFQAVAQYNQGLAGLEWAKGTIQKYNNVSVADGALPAHVQEKAAEHFRAREAAIKLREHPADLPLMPLTDKWDGALENVPKLPDLKPGTVLPQMPTPPMAPAPTPLPMQGAAPAKSAIAPWPGGVAAPEVPGDVTFKQVDSATLFRRGVPDKPAVPATTMALPK